MAGAVVYADLQIPSEPLSSRTFHSSHQPYAFRHPRWQKTALWIACVGNVVLLAALITLALQFGLNKETGGMNVSKWTNRLECNASSDSFKSHLRSKLCNESQGDSTCQVCPPYWVFHRDKCYWFNLEGSLKTWNASQEDCSGRNSHLLVIQDMEDMDFVTKNTLDHTHYTYWIGSSLSLSMKKQIRVTGSQINQAAFQEQKHEKNKYCGALKNKKIISEPCSSILRWICQKDAIFI